MCILGHSKYIILLAFYVIFAGCQKAPVYDRSPTLASANGLGGTVYSTASTSNMLLLEGSSRSESPAGGVNVNIYSITGETQTPELMTTSTTDARGDYAASLDFSGINTLLAVALKDGASVGQTLVVIPAALADSTTSSLVADINLESTLTSALLLKKNVNLTTLSSTALDSVTKLITEEIADDSSTDPTTLLIGLTSSDDTSNAVATAVGDKKASTDRPDSSLGPLVLLIPKDGVVRTSLSSLSLEQSRSQISPDASATFTAYATYSDGSKVNVSAKAAWSSRDTDVATINKASTVLTATGVSDGTTTISCNFGGKSVERSLTVVTPTLLSIAVTPATPTITYAGTQQFVATGTYSDATTANITSSSTWTSGTPGVATIGAGNGLAAAVTLGSTTITASKGSVNGSTVMTVIAQPAPPNPTGQAAVANSGVQISLSWVSGGSSTASYQIAYQTGSAPADCASGTTDTSVTNSKTIGGLTPLTQYFFRICAVNTNSTPDVSSGVTTSATTLQASPPDPSGQTSTADSTTQITVTWNSGGGSTSSYKVAYQLGTSAPASCSVGTTATTSSTSLPITGLQSDTDYAFRICALNANATPDVSAGVTTTKKTLQVAPPNPSSPTATVDSSSQITLSWAAAGGTTAGYKIAYQTSSYPSANCASGTTTTTTSLTIPISSLNASTAYFFRICAYNANGTPDVSSGVTTTETTSASLTVSDWDLVDGAGVNGFNKVAADNAYNSQLTVFNSKLYMIWHENLRIRVAVYNGDDLSPSRAFVDGGTATGINQLTSGGIGYNAQLTVFNSKLYATWVESTTSWGGASEIRVAVYNGNDNSPGWSMVDGDTAAGINRFPAASADKPQLTVFNSKLYATWYEYSTDGSSMKQIRVAVFNGNDTTPSWSFVDGNGINGINKNTGKDGIDPQLTVFNSKLYITWRESGTSAYQTRVAVYNGNDTSAGWAFVDGGGTEGINKNTGKGVAATQLTVFNSKLYAIWGEENGGRMQARVAVYNGNDGSASWAFVDGAGANGLNKDSGRNANDVQLTVFGSTLYGTWVEYDGNDGSSQVRIIAYNGDDNSPSWNFVDGDGTNGINKNSSKETNFAQLTVFNSKLYATWTEVNTSSRQIRMAVGN